ncbi:MAG: hypothetical protein RR626_09600 [Anaerovoracaceae bacterium]
MTKRICKVCENEEIGEKGMTINDLYKVLQEEIDLGNGGAKILLYTDGNGYASSLEFVDIDEKRLLLSAHGR